MDNLNQMNVNKDKNGLIIQNDQIVKISNAFFESDNGFYLVVNSPGDKNWSGNEHCLHRCSKGGKESISKRKTNFWPLTCWVSSVETCKKGRDHNSKHATIEIIK